MENIKKHIEGRISSMVPDQFPDYVVPRIDYARVDLWNEISQIMFEIRVPIEHHLKSIMKKQK